MIARERLEPDALVVVFIGASAVGKSAVAGELCESGVTEATPTWTTRKPRRGEADTSYDHRFVSEEEFDCQSGKDGFMDVHELYGARYGMPFLSQPAEGREALMILKPSFIPVLLSHFPMARIYNIEASADVLPARMQARGQSWQDIEHRMSKHASEVTAARRLEHARFYNNGPLEETVELIRQQIRADRLAHDL
jgi:guanylate kinase